MNVFRLMPVVIILIASALTTCSKKTEVKKNQKDYVLIKGSDSELPLVKYFASVCAEHQGEKKIVVEGGGSGTGIEALIAGKADVANSSRQINSQELKLARDKGINIYPVIFAIDAVAFIVHSETGVDSLSVAQLKSIFNGQIRNWNEVGGNNLPVILYGRNEHSGTYAYIKSKLGLSEFSTRLTQLEDNENIYQIVKSEKGAIGYVSLHTIMNTEGRPVGDVWAINVYVDSLRSVSPYQIERVLSGEYVFNRPLYQYFNGRPKGILKDLVDTELSPNGQSLLRRFGYFPLTDYQVYINREQFEKTD
jgi:phosphate transport system substrate-binding protein